MDDAHELLCLLEKTRWSMNARRLCGESIDGQAASAIYRDAILASDWLKARDQLVREECAKVAEHFRDNAYGEGMNEDTVMARSFMANDIAAAIRGEVK